MLAGTCDFRWYRLLLQKTNVHSRKMCLLSRVLAVIRGLPVEIILKDHGKLVSINYCSNHPCNARGSCSIPPGKYAESERYDASVLIPRNLEDGIYFLQW